jgi:integrase
MEEYRGLMVEESLIPSTRTSSGYRKLFIITEDDIPLREVNNWVDTYSINSYLTGREYAYVLLDFLRFLKRRNIHYRDVNNKKILDAYIKHLVYGDNQNTNLIGKKSLDQVKRSLSIIKGFYEWLEENGEIIFNPVRYGVRKDSNNKAFLKGKFLYGQIWSYDIDKSTSLTKLRFKRKQNHLKWYTSEEENLILNHLPTLRNKIIFRITLETGMRIGEVLGLKIDDIDTFDGLIYVKWEMNIENDALVKTNERDLPISEELTELISIYIRGERINSLVDNNDFLFLNSRGKNKGKPVRPRNFLKILKLAAKKSGLDPKIIRTHSGRSTLAQKFVDELNKGNISEQAILDQFGWTSISTLKRYKKTFNDKGRLKVARNIVEKRINYKRD